MKDPADSLIPPVMIAPRAYRYWEEAGRCDGQDLEHWLRAEAELQRELFPAAKATPRGFVPAPAGTAGGNRKGEHTNNSPRPARTRAGSMSAI